MIMKENVKFNNRVVLFCLTAAAGISLFALAGWFAGWAHISSFGAGYIPMAPNTALVFLTSAAAMYVLRKFGSQENKSEPAVMVIVSLNTILLFLTIVDTLSGRHLNIDGMIIRAAGFVGGVPIGSMSLLTEAFESRRTGGDEHNSRFICYQYGICLQDPFSLREQCYTDGIFYRFRFFIFRRSGNIFGRRRHMAA